MWERFKKHHKTIYIIFVDHEINQSFDYYFSGIFVVLCCPVLSCAVLCCTVLSCSVLCCVLLHCTVVVVLL